MQRVAQSKFRIWVKLVALACILHLPGIASAEWVEWFADTQVAYERIDNINAGLSAFNEELDDNRAVLTATAGRSYQLGGYTRINISGDLEYYAHQEYNDINAIVGGLSLGVWHKFGLGRDKPWLLAKAFAGLHESADDIRDRTVVRFNLGGGMRFLPWLEGRLTYGYLQEDGDEGEIPVEFSTWGVSSDVYDLSRSSLELALTADIGQYWRLGGTFAAVQGEFVAGCTVNSYDTSYQLGQTGAVSYDDAFGVDAANRRCLYTLDGSGRVYSVVLGYAIGRQSALDLSYQSQKIEGDVYSYTTNILRLGYLYSF